MAAVLSVTVTLTRLFLESRMLVSIMSVTFFDVSHPGLHLLFHLMSPSLLPEVQLLLGSEVTISGTQDVGFSFL